MDTKSKVNFYGKGFKVIALIIALLGAMIITGIISQVNSVESIYAFTQGKQGYARSLVDQKAYEFRRALSSINYIEKGNYYDPYQVTRLEENKKISETYLDQGFRYFYVNSSGEILADDGYGVQIESGKAIGENYYVYSTWEEKVIEGQSAYLRMAVPKELFLTMLIEAEIVSVNGQDNLIAIIVGSILLLIGAIYLIVVSGKSSKNDNVILKGMDKIYTDVLIVLTGLADVGIGALGVVAYSKLTSPEFGNFAEVTIIFLGLGFFVINAFGVLNIAKKIKAKRFFRQTLTWNLISKIGVPIEKLVNSKSGVYAKESFTSLKELSNKSIYRSIMSWCAITMGLSLVIILVSLPFGIIPAFVGLPLLAVFMVKKITNTTSEFVEISKGVSEIRNGNYNYKIEKLKCQEFNEVAEDINNIAEGMDLAVTKAIKAEQLKSELITNVSHDLKTPLTSIIGYVELLQDMDLPEEAQSYVNIIDQKSDRLKHIIQDLFELTKSNSGNVEVELEDLDLVKLIHQTLGELENDIEKSGRTLKINCDLESAIVKADGKRLYRVLQNLLDNALKYSLEGTRIFIDLKEEEDNIIFEIKNTSSYEMDFDESEILQRFTRGDKARTTEGSGLGLSIAESFASLQGAGFEIQIDGDQFKARLKFSKQK